MLDVHDYRFIPRGSVYCFEIKSMPDSKWKLLSTYGRTKYLQYEALAAVIKRVSELSYDRKECIDIICRYLRYLAHAIHKSKSKDQFDIWSKEVILSFKHDYIYGMPLEDLSRRYMISHKDIYRLCRRHGIHRKIARAHALRGKVFTWSANRVRDLIGDIYLLSEGEIVTKYKVDRKMIPRYKQYIASGLLTVEWTDYHTDSVIEFITDKISENELLERCAEFDEAKIYAHIRAFRLHKTHLSNYQA